MRHKPDGVVRVRRSKLAAVAAFLVIAAVGRSALAGNSSWNALNGNFNTVGNWTNGVPGSGDTAVFRRGSAVSYTVTFPGAGLRSDPINFVTDQLRIGSNTVSFVDGTDFNHVVVASTYTLDNTTTAESGRGIIIGETGSDTAAVLTTRLATLSAVAATIGDAAGTNGTLNVSAGTFNITGASGYELIVGRNGSSTGTLNVSGGADVNVNGANGESVLGEYAGSHGTATVTGSGSTWSTSSYAIVGSSGAGTLNITAGGQMTSGSGSIGSTGTASVDGSGSKWTISNNNGLGGGNFGILWVDGALNITNGGQVSSTDDDYISGGATIDGPGSIWTTTSQLYVGNAGGGNGSLAITGGGQVVCNSVATVYGSASATIMGVGSTWTIGPELDVLGTLNINSGGQVSDSNGYITPDIGFGSSTVAGSGSKWTNSGDLWVGRSDRGTLNINSGGQVNNVDGYIQHFSIVTVDGPGSKWTSSGALHIGAELDVTGAGLVTSATSDLGNTSGFGTASIDGAGSQWNVTGNLGVGGVGSGTLTVSGGGTVTVGGLLSVGGGGTVKGNGAITGNVSNGGVVAPGNSSGALHINGNYTQTAAGKLQIELGGTTAGTLYDQLIISGAVTLGGALQVSLINSFAPAWGSSFDILDWGTVGGVFSTLPLPTLNAGLSWNTSQLYTDGILNIMLTGDYNLNGVVDAADYAVWRKGLGTIYGPADYNVWRAHFGQTAGSGAGTLANAAVPEPATLVLLMLAAAGWCLRRGRAA